MGIEGRLSDLETRFGPATGPIRIKVCRITPVVPEDEQDAWIAAHPDCVAKVVEIVPGHPPRVLRSK